MPPPKRRPPAPAKPAPAVVRPPAEPVDVAQLARVVEAYTLKGHRILKLWETSAAAIQLLDDGLSLDALHGTTLYSYDAFRSVRAYFIAVNVLHRGLDLPESEMER